MNLQPLPWWEQKTARRTTRLSHRPAAYAGQMLYEFGGPDLRVIMAKSENDWQEMTLGELLPLGFGPEKVL